MLDKILNEEHKNLIFVFLFISLTLICIPRFDRTDYGIIKNFVGNEELYEGMPYDILIYKNYIEYFRSGEGENKISPPYTYRIFVPFIASLLPFAPLTSLNLVNLIFLYIGLICLYFTLKKLQFNFKLRVVGAMIYIFSFPMFYYATSGYIDGSFVGLLTACVYLTVSRKWFLLLLFILISTLTSEKIIILFPFLITFLFTEKINLKMSLTIIAVSIFLYVSTSYLIRKFTPASSQTYIWIPDLKFILQNIYRPKTYLSFIFTFGIPGILAVLSLFKLSKDEIKKFLYFYVGGITSVILYLYSILSAWSDGRPIWTMYAFVIPIAVLYVKEMELKNFNEFN